MRRLLKSNAWSARRADAAALACVGLFFVAFFPQALLGGKYLLAGDAFFYSYPLRTVAWRMIRQGQLPLWTPYIMSGYPLLSMAQLGLGYPLTWGYLFLPGRVAEQIYVLAPFLLAPTFTYAYLREVRRTPLAALLGALTFGYGGMMASPLAGNGLMPNAVMWLPLFLIAIERARHQPFVLCLLGATAAYAMSVLTGVAQGFLYVGLLAGAYALFLVFTIDDYKQRNLRARLASVRQWRPLFVAAGASLLAAGVAAFQILETGRAVRRSVRSVLTYELFAQGSFRPAELWRSIFEPLFYVIDMHAYVPPLALALAGVAIYGHARRREGRDPHVFFWLVVALVAYLLMMGAFTPLYRIVYYLPLLNLFRVPSRHTFEWTLALGVLAAYGWDFVAAIVRRQRAMHERTMLSTLYAASALLACSIFVGALWWQRVQTLPTEAALDLSGAHRVYQLWKAVFVLLTLGALWRASLIRPVRWRSGLLMACVLVLCFVEPSALIARWWSRLGLKAERFSTPALTTPYLRQFPPTENRVYTRVELMSEQFGNPPIFDAANLSAVYGLHNVAGYEPLILERYSRALGGVGLDTVHTFKDGTPDDSLFNAHSHVLDILNTTFVASYPNLGLTPSSAANPPPAASAAQLKTAAQQPVPVASPYSDAWQPIHEWDPPLILHNTRAQQRAWLVAAAEAVDGEEALHRIRGESATEFDPRRTALLEVKPIELPRLPGGILARESAAHITRYEPNHLVIETSAPHATVLVVSEIFYPGWVATVDGRAAPIMLTDFLLRGIALPAGGHTVEMRYTAPAARNGAVISALTLCLLLGLAIYARRRQASGRVL